MPAKCSWCNTKAATREMAGFPLCDGDYTKAKKAVYVDRRNLADVLAERAAAPEERVEAPVEQATAAPGEKRATKRQT